MNPIKAHLLNALRPQVPPMTETEYLPVALRTWTAPLRGTGDGIAYLQLGLLSEVGELAAVLKRMMRDGTPLDVAQDRFDNEFEDVLWYEAILGWEGGFSSDPRHGVNGWTSLNVLTEVCTVAEAMGLKLNPDRARAKNIAKLTSRAERGVIQGSGGDR